MSLDYAAVSAAPQLAAAAQFHCPTSGWLPALRPTLAGGSPRRRIAPRRRELIIRSIVPIGYLVTVTLVAWCTMLALVPLRRPFALGAISFFFGFVLNELPFVVFYWLLASTCSRSTRVMPTREQVGWRWACLR
jgi:hypothetical protein